MWTARRDGYAAWLGAMGLLLLVAAVPAEAQDGNWNGFYAGVNAGGTWGDADTNTSCLDNQFGGAFCTAIAAEGALPFNMSNDLNGFIGGVQAGYNVQRGLMVFGVEADIAWTSIDSNTSNSNGATASFLPSVTTASQELNWLGTVRGRLGYAVHGNMLLYATGGLAYGNVDNSYSHVFTNGDYARASQSKTKAGWTVGGGGEYGFGRWSLKGEYLYYDLGDETLSAQAIDANGFRNNLYLDSEYETKGHIVRVGLNFKLGHHSRAAVPLK